jgi:hypothetical protein
MVKAGAAESTLRRIAPNDITQFGVRQGSFTVEVQDAINPNLRAAQQFSTRSNRVTRILVSIEGGFIFIQEAPASATF